MLFYVYGGPQAPTVQNSWQIYPGFATGERFVPGGSRWFSGANETVPDPTRLTRVGQVAGAGAGLGELPAAIGQLQAEARTERRGDTLLVALDTETIAADSAHKYRLTSHAMITLARDFVDVDNRAAVNRARFMAIVAFILSIPFGAMDLLLRPDHLASLMQLRALGLVALLLVIAAATWWAAAHRHIQVVTCGAVTLYSWCTVAADLLTPIPRN